MVNMTSMKNMPAIPDLFYRSEWKGWDDFLGTQYPYDWELVEILKFNYNGLGDAIANCDGRVTYMHQVDLNAILFGSQYGGTHYDTVVSSGRFILKRSAISKAAEEVVSAKPKPKPKRKSSKNVRAKKTKKV